ncbi:MAG: DNA gyrase inhibitor YacG [Deltaproteobacteria bacterium]|nr:DNA gyrase inhibitor YacG [Deltaproteobacteria bacterium]
MSICPICGAEVKPRGVNKAHPFCSARCKSIDLGKWLNEDYRVHTEEHPIDDDAPLKPDMRN